MKGVTPPSILRTLVNLAGGIRHVAAAAGVDASNLARYLRGQGGLSAKRLEDVEEVLGRSRDRTVGAYVTLIEVDQVDEDLQTAIGWLFPSGAEVARGAWSRASRIFLAREFESGPLPRVYALRDGVTRCVVRFMNGRKLPQHLFPELPNIVWWNDDPHRAALDVVSPFSWIRGDLEAVVFDAAWPDANPNPTLDDLLSEIMRLDISMFEAIRRLQRNEPQRHRPVLKNPMHSLKD